MTREGNAAKRAEDSTRPPWDRWKGTRTARFIRFAQRYLRTGRGETFGQPLKLLSWQKEFVDAYYADGVSAAVLGMGRGGGKSTFIAALAAFDLFEGDSQGAPVVPIVAASLNQAKTAVYGQIVSMIQAEPELARRTLIFSGIGSERILYPRTGGTIVPRSSDPDTLQGLDVWPGGYVDEIGHVPQASWDAVLLGRKRKGARVLGAGTWGPDLNSPLYQLRKMVREGNAPPDFLWKMFTGDPKASITDEKNWHKGNPSLAHGLPAIEHLRNDVVMSPEAAFRTYRLNEPDVTGHDSWLGPDANARWAGLEDPYELVLRAPTWVGVDIGRIRDCTGVVVVQQRPDGRLHARAKIWTPKPDQEVDLLDVSSYLTELSFKYDVQEVRYDPRFFELEAIRLRLGRINMVETPQSPETMTPIVAGLRELIFKAGLSHDVDELFGQHVVNAVARTIGRAYMLDKDKSAPRGHIDACIGLALAVDAFAHKRKKVGVYVGSVG